MNFQNLLLLSYKLQWPPGGQEREVDRDGEVENGMIAGGDLGVEREEGIKIPRDPFQERTIEGGPHHQ